MSTKSHAKRPRLRAVAVLPLSAVLAGSFTLADSAVASAATATARAAVAVPGTHPAWATSAADRGSVPDRDQVTTTVYLAGRDQAGMAAYAAAVADPHSASYRRYLTPDQFQARFGTSVAQNAAVRDWARVAGLTVSALDARSLTVTGSAAVVARAFSTRLHDYAVSGRVFRAPDADARVPAAIAGDVLTVTGLDDMPRLMRRGSLVGEESTPTVPGISGTKARQSTGSDGSPFLGPTPCSAYYGQLEDTTDPAFTGQTESPYAICGYVPSQLRAAYGVDEATSAHAGHGVRVAIVDAYGSPTMLSDANTYAANHHDPVFTPGQYTETVTPGQWTNEAACGGPSGWAGEESLDVEAVHAMAPGAQVHYYGSDSCLDADFLKVFTQIVDTHSADLVSDSWGEPVYSTTGDEAAAVMAEYTSLFQQGAIEGIGFSFSSGDCGAEDPATSCGKADTSSTPQADFPASDPWATSVGGTSVAIDKHDSVAWTSSWGTDGFVLANGKWQPVGWVYGGGGGTSAVFAQPGYQRTIVSHRLATSLPDRTRTDQPMRVTPDIAMDADPFTGFLIGMTQTLPGGATGYAESDIGGTSLACPLFTGLQADLIAAHGGTPTGFANPRLYGKYRTVLLRDVTGHSPGTNVANILPAYQGSPAVLVTFGDDRLLWASRGYDDATGLGTASGAYLWWQ
ncbi:S8/S53 family peptidase [Actinospica durhamensis]|uniref:S8/S53 family peptidase n=1 Tax=Actinospica durhamensis TaxID=1508375 RepID=A0A941IUD2_9ACTN|nr:S53 family peptidase [Actinospica durhamensis]MBR7837298.1 S8/S53 family peptidase [Actinospica durhamensis]